jgi:hypothetical protein
VSPDRAVSPAGSASEHRGDALNTSSAQEFSAIRTVKVDCSGATPGAGIGLAGMSGKVWLTNEWNVANTDNPPPLDSGVSFGSGHLCGGPLPDRAYCRCALRVLEGYSAGDVFCKRGR